MKTAHRIETLKGGRFISHHDHAEVYYDFRHKVIKTRMEGGGFFALIKEMQADGSYRNQMLSAVSASAERLIIEYPENKQNQR
jgi:hypothetical protein